MRCTMTYWAPVTTSLAAVHSPHSDTGSDLIAKVSFHRTCFYGRILIRLCLLTSLVHAAVVAR